MLMEITHLQSINDAISQMSPGDILVLNDGIYHEKVEIWLDNITIRAKNIGKAIITNKDYYHKIMPDKNECNTFHTYTVYVGGNHIHLEGLLLQNEAIPSNVYGQAVALHVDGNHFQCEHCIIESAQDTLFTGPLPEDLCKRYASFYPPEKLKGISSKQIYKHCTIKGDVDFIFGCATALFEECTIITIDSNRTTPSFVCAPAHPKELPFGYLFYHCQFKGKEKAFLARPWRDYGCAAFIECELGDHILPKGYDKWNDTHRDQTARFYEYTKNKDVSQRVSWSHQLSSVEAKTYIINFKTFLEKK
ncbi:MAG: pectinesterase family protein [Roseburia sp.]|nr:pectinesterase family protein [Anaeroplasma bactoclasticum]MCM1196451.1 pectinesterase family protein [Roseburia sp.]